MEGGAEIILKGDLPRTIQAIWFRDFREDLNVILYKNMSNLHNAQKDLQKNPGIC